jgi:SnoaL-like protein
MRIQMRKHLPAVLSAAALALGVGIAVPATASAAPSGRTGAAVAQHTNWLLEYCKRGFDAAVHEDNNAYNAKDADRYEAILNPRMIFWQDGAVTYGRDAIMATARQSFAVPGWTWTYEILSETVYGCDSGIAVLDTHLLRPDIGVDRHFAVSMGLVREHGRWSVAIDNVHLLPS